MSRHHILALAAVAAVAYAFGYYRAQHAAVANSSASTSALGAGTDWLNWQAAP